MLLQSLLKYDTSACQRNDVVRDACQIRRQGICGNREGAGRIEADPSSRPLAAGLQRNWVQGEALVRIGHGALRLGNS